MDRLEVFEERGREILGSKFLGCTVKQRYGVDM